jgi:membrane-associated phospholipid phosphatase
VAHVVSQERLQPAEGVRVRPDTCWWAVDKAVIGYYLAACGMLLAVWNRVPEAGALLAAHLAALALLWVMVKRPSRWSWGFRHWYALPYVAACYKEMAIVIPPLGPWNADQWLSNLDFRFWGAHPTIWLERIYHPALTEFLQIVYTLFVPAVLLIPFLIWRRQRYADFRYLAFLIAMGFLVSYVGYLFVPARGPRFLLKHLERLPLQGMWLFQTMQATLDRLESAHYDCFPSGHTELTIIACWASRLVSAKLFWLYFAYTISIIFATVYLRYHYTVDVLAGTLTALSLIAVSPVLYRKFSPRGSNIGGN